MENSTAETEVVLLDDAADTVSEVAIQLRHPSRVFPRVPRSAIARMVIVPPGPSQTSPLKRTRNQVKPASSPPREPLKRAKAAAPRPKPGRPAKAAALPAPKKAGNMFLEKPQPLPKPTPTQPNAKPGAKQAASASEIKTPQKSKRKHEESDEEEAEEEEEEEEEEEWEEEEDSEDNSEDDTWEPEKNPSKSKKVQNNITENKWKASPQSKINAASKTEKSTGPLTTGVKEDTHPCPECGIVFFQKGTLTKHLTIHKQQKLLTPGKREETFSNAKTQQLSKPALQENKFVPTTGKKPNPCTECEKSFNCPLMLQKHLTVHEQEKKEKMLRAQKVKEKVDAVERTNEKSEKPNKIPVKNEKSNVNNEKKNLNEKTNMKINEKIEKTQPKTEETKGNARAKNHKPIAKPEKLKEKSKVPVEKTEIITRKEKNEAFRAEKIGKSNEKNGKNKIDTDECTQDTFHVKNAEKVSARFQI